MSVKAMAWAWQQKGTPSQKLVLLCLADHADHDGICWPGQLHVAEKCGVSRETVIRVVHHYEERRKIEVIRRHDEAGRNLSNSYRLRLENVDDEETPSPVKLQKSRKSRKAKQDVTKYHPDVTRDHHPVTKDHQDGDERSPGDGDISSPLEPSVYEPSLEPIKNPPPTPQGGRAGKKPKSPPDFTPAFELTWEAYPKRAGYNPKPQAFAAWNARLKEGHAPEELQEGVKRYASFLRATGKEDTQYVQQAVNFFGPSKPFLADWTPPQPKLASQPAEPRPGCMKPFPREAKGGGR